MRLPDGFALCIDATIEDDECAFLDLSGVLLAIVRRHGALDDWRLTLDCQAASRGAPGSGEVFATFTAGVAAATRWGCSNERRLRCEVRDAADLVP